MGPIPKELLLLFSSTSSFLASVNQPSLTKKKRERGKTKTKKKEARCGMMVIGWSKKTYIDPNIAAATAAFTKQVWNKRKPPSSSSAAVTTMRGRERESLACSATTRQAQAAAAWRRMVGLPPLSFFLESLPLSLSPLHHLKKGRRTNQQRKTRARWAATNQSLSLLKNLLLYREREEGDKKKLIVMGIVPRESISSFFSNTTKFVV